MVDLGQQLRLLHLLGRFCLRAHQHHFHLLATVRLRWVEFRDEAQAQKQQGVDPRGDQQGISDGGWSGLPWDGQRHDLRAEGSA
jgi:hypothetical protein